MLKDIKEEGEYKCKKAFGGTKSVKEDELIDVEICSRAIFPNFREMY